MEERQLGKRQQILDAATRVFADKGFHAAKIDDIAQEAAIGKGTVYEYFASKDELFLEMLKEVTQTYHDKVFDLQRGTCSCAEKIKTILYTHLLFIHEHSKLARILMTEPFGMSDPVRKCSVLMRQQRLKIIAELLTEGINIGEFRPLSVEVTAQVLLGAVASVGFTQVLEGKQFVPEALMEEIYTTILKGIQQ